MRLSPLLRLSALVKPAFRDTYKLPDNFTYSGWYQRHMFKGMKQMQAKLRYIDFVIEVHDARIPLSGRNADFCTYLYAVKPHVLLLNKTDLVEKEQRERMEHTLRAANPNLKNIFWTSAKFDPVGTARYLKDLIISEIQHIPRYNRSYSNDYNIMVVGTFLFLLIFCALVLGCFLCFLLTSALKLYV